MKLDETALLDACVLLPMPLADTLLRLAEEPRLYRPRWSDETLAEVTRNLIGHWKKTPQQANQRAEAMTAAFPEARITNYEHLVQAMTNDPKDRHILAAAAASETKRIVTYNAKHFPEASLEPYGIECMGPSKFLISLYDLAPDLVAQRLIEQAETIDITLRVLLSKLRINVPGFVTVFCDEKKLDFSKLD